MGLEPFVAVGWLSAGIDGEPVEVFPAHFPGGGDGATRIQVECDQSGLPKIPLPDDLRGVIQVLEGVQGLVFIDDVFGGNPQAERIGGHHACVGNTQPLVVAGAHDERRIWESYPPFDGQLDLGDGRFRGSRTILQGVGRYDETIRMGGRMIGDDPLFFEGETHARTIANKMPPVKHKGTPGIFLFSARPFRRIPANRIE